MRDKSRPRYDYAPCNAAHESIEDAAERWKNDGLTRQGVIDKLVILGLWAEQQRAQLRSMPTLYGRQRKTWKRP